MNGIDKKYLLLVDDDALNLDILSGLLSEEFETRCAADGEGALELVAGTPVPDMLLLDVEMPGIDGFSVCRALKDNPRTSATPIIFLTAHDTVEEITRGFACGAVDFISKPVIPEVLRARVRTHLRLTEARRLLEDQNRHLEDLVQQRTSALRQQTDALLRAQELSIVALGEVAETRDNETGNHIYRTQEYVRALLDELAPSLGLDANSVNMIWKSSPLHDIGKVGIPDHILLKPGKLDAAEFEIMKSHTTLGRNALHSAERRVQLDTSFLRTAAEIAYTHHERWDGRGYPEGLVGEAIPISGRLMAVADVYDALISRRVYKPAFPHEVALDLIRAERGRQFDPNVTDCFLAMEQRMFAVAERFRDID